jgi:hypothetical protein
MKRLFVSCVVLLALGLDAAVGEEVDDEIQKDIVAYTVLGEIHEIDLATRKAIISGYEYSFSGQNGYERPSVKLYGSQAGSLELLRTNMRVRIAYLHGDEARIVMSLQEVDASLPENALNE